MCKEAGWSSEDGVELVRAQGIEGGARGVPRSIEQQAALFFMGTALPSEFWVTPDKGITLPVRCSRDGGCWEARSVCPMWSWGHMAK